jgi:hypothetical protein
MSHKNISIVDIKLIDHKNISIVDKYVFNDKGRVKVSFEMNKEPKTHSKLALT